MFSTEWSFTPQESCALDAMHTWCLGLHAQFAGYALWHFVHSNTQHISTTTNLRRERHDQNLAHVRVRLEKWYQEAQSAGIVISKVAELTLETMGPRKKPFMRTKAHESLTLLRWLSSFCTEWKGVLPAGEAWSQAATCLMEMWTLLDTAAMQVPEQTIQDRPAGKGLKRVQLPPCKCTSDEKKKNVICVHSTSLAQKKKNPRRVGFHMESVLRVSFEGFE